MTTTQRPLLLSVRTPPLLTFMSGALMGLSAQAAPRPECVELTPLYLQSVAQLKSTQEAFISSSCNEHPEEESCKRLTLSGQEIMSTLQMLTLKMKASECNPNASSQRALNSCERLSKMIKNADKKLAELSGQATAQRCQARPNTPTCRALSEARVPHLNIIRAVEKKRSAQGCSSSTPPPSEAK